jgi:threonine synthase
VLLGLAPDGGLLVPQEFPSVSSDDWALWKTFDYRQLCFAVLRKFIDLEEVSDEELRTMIDSA